MAGFASSMLGQVDLYVNNDEVDKAKVMVNEIVMDSKD